MTFVVSCGNEQLQEKRLMDRVCHFLDKIVIIQRFFYFQNLELCSFESDLLAALISKETTNNKW